MVSSVNEIQRNLAENKGLVHAVKIRWVPLDCISEDLTFGEVLRPNTKNCEVQVVKWKSTVSVKSIKQRKWWFVKEFKCLKSAVEVSGSCRYHIGGKITLRKA